MVRWWSVLACLACLAAAGAQAQVYRCEEGGRTVFSDRPCGAGVQVMDKAKMDAAPQGSVNFDVITRHYPVDGDNLRAARLWMVRNNPGGFSGWARWKVIYKFDTLPRPAGCSIDRLRIDIAGDILMPRWQQYDRVQREEQAGWDRMYAALKIHEDGHIQHGREFAVLVRQRLLGLGTVPCTELTARAQAEYDRLYQNLQTRDADYDRRTEHGLRQDNPR